MTTFSPSPLDRLGLNISKAEAVEIAEQADINGDAAINYNEFIPILKDLLNKVYAAKDDGYNQWCDLTVHMLGSSP